MTLNVTSLKHLLEQQKRWSEETFGLGSRTERILDHITKEIEEVRAAPHDVEEWIDLVILAFDGAWRAGHSPEEVVMALNAKYEKNFSRKWPDWREAEDGKAIEHIREGEEA